MPGVRVKVIAPSNYSLLGPAAESGSAPAADAWQPQNIQLRTDAEGKIKIAVKLPYTAAANYAYKITATAAVSSTAKVTFSATINSPPGDKDGDGMPDTWETQVAITTPEGLILPAHKFNSADPKDATESPLHYGYHRNTPLACLTDPLTNRLTVAQLKALTGLRDETTGFYREYGVAITSGLVTSEQWKILNLIDPDHDGRSNLEEYQNDTHPRVPDCPDTANRDTDGDGFTNQEEFSAGKSYLDGTNFPPISLVVDAATDLQTTLIHEALPNAVRIQALYKGNPKPGIPIKVSVLNNFTLFSPDVVEPQWRPGSRTFITGDQGWICFRVKGPYPTTLPMTTLSVTAAHAMSATTKTTFTATLTTNPPDTTPDTDRDGMSDAWEAAYGFSVNSSGNADISPFNFGYHRDTPISQLPSLVQIALQIPRDSYGLFIYNSSLTAQQTTILNTIDPDHDGLSNLLEYKLNSNPVIADLTDIINRGADTDHDGFSDLEELLLGTDPTDASSDPGKLLNSRAITTPPLGSVNNTANDPFKLVWDAPRIHVQRYKNYYYNPFDYKVDFYENSTITHFGDNSALTSEEDFPKAGGGKTAPTVRELIAKCQFPGLTEIVQQVILPASSPLWQCSFNVENIYSTSDPTFLNTTHKYWNCAGARVVAQTPSSSNPLTAVNVNLSQGTKVTYLRTKTTTGAPPLATVTQVLGTYTFTIPPGECKSEVFPTLLSFPFTNPPDSDSTVSITYDLLPIDFENPRGPIHELQISDSAPRVELNALTNSSVSVSGSQASVQISGKVFDPITALLPPGTVDLTSLRVYVNGTKLSTTGNLQRQSADQGLWKPYGDKFTISPFNVSFPARGTNLVRIETPPNAAGMIGKVEFEVNFRTEITPRPPIPAFTVEQDIILSGALNSNAKDTVQLAAVDGPPSITLTETDDDTGVFASTQGHAFVMTKTFTASGSADRLPCSLMLPGSPMSFSLRGQSGQCVETGPQTMRFRYSETIPGRPQDSIRTEVLDGVQMHPIRKEQDGWFPITLKMGSEIEGLKLKWFGKEFPIKPTSSGICPTTKEGKPLVGVVVKRSQEAANPEQDPPPPVLEFMYYDHTASSIVRVPLDESQGKHEWKLMKESQEVHTGQLPLKQITFVNAGGSLAEGILPLPIETLQSILEGDTPEIGTEQYAFIELRGHIDGEVVRFGNEEAPFDYYDLIAGEAETLLQESPRHVRLQKLGDRKFRTTQKVVIYGTSDTSQQELTQSQWLALRDAGYLAIHNPKKKVFWGKEDIEWLTKERGSFHPPGGSKMGLPGATDPTKLDFHLFEGFDDHHIFNKFHGDNGTGKALAWSKLFEGEGFDVDEFTVPVRKGVHSKVQHLADKGWRSFIGEVFDATTGELKPGITGKVLAQKRGEAFALMGTLVEEMGLELKWVRAYPKGVLASRLARPGLYNRLVNSRGRLGESLNRLGSMSTKYLKALGSAATEEGERLFKKHVKRFLKSGGKGVAVCLPLIFSFQSHANAHQMLAHTMAFGPKEGAAVWLNLSTELEDLPLARNIVEQNWQMFQDLIAGADGKLCAQLPSGTVIKVGDPSFNCDYDGFGKIVHITPYVITNIWQFPDGRVKLRAKMTEDPYTGIEEDDAEWFITDWYPAIGETRADWLEACQRAGAFNDYGDP